MKKKYLLSLFIVLTMFITGCSDGVKQEDGKTTYSCVKKGIDQTSSTSNTSWKEDITYTAKLDDNKKLVYYSSKFHYTYDTKDACNYWCDIKVKWNKEINDKNYTGSHRETTCNCNSNELTEEYIYDNIENLASITRSDIKELNSDNSFKLEEWQEKYRKINYDCN